MAAATFASCCHILLEDNVFTGIPRLFGWYHDNFAANENTRTSRHSAIPAPRAHCSCLVLPKSRIISIHHTIGVQRNTLSILDADLHDSVSRSHPGDTVILFPARSLTCP